MLMDISAEVTEATEATQNVYKNEDISTKASKAPKNVHKNMDISIKATEVSEARKCPQKCGHFDGGYQGH